ELTEAGSAADAEESLRPAVLRLAMLALPEQFKYARKRFADDRDIVLLGQGLSTKRRWRSHWPSEPSASASWATTRPRCRARQSSSRLCSIVIAAASAKSSIAY